MFEPLVNSAAVLGLLAVAVWRSPDWGRKWLAFARDLRRYRRGQ